MIKSLMIRFLRRVKESGEEMRILGIDPGYALMGYGIIEKREISSPCAITAVFPQKRERPCPRD